LTAFCTENNRLLPPPLSSGQLQVPPVRSEAQQYAQARAERENAIGAPADSGRVFKHVARTFIWFDKGVFNPSSSSTFTASIAGLRRFVKVAAEGAGIMAGALLRMRFRAAVLSKKATGCSWHPQDVKPLPFKRVDRAPFSVTTTSSNTSLAFACR